MEYITNAELARLRNAKNPPDWNSITDDIKRSHGGKYPDDWYEKVILSGLYHSVSSDPRS